MKKIYTFLITSAISAAIYGQGSVNFDTAGNWSPTPNGYGNYTYTDTNFSSEGTNVLRETSTTQDGFAGFFGTYAVRLRNTSDSQLSMTVVSGGVGSFSFQARRWDGSPDTYFTVDYSVDGGSTWTHVQDIDATVTTDSDWKTISGTIENTNPNITVRVKSLGTTERLMVDNFTWTAPTTAAVVDVNTKKVSLVKNTVTNAALTFGATTSAKIINTNGQIVKSVVVESDETIDVSFLPKGIYIVTGQVNGKVVSQKIIKQ